jgi:hypothetical protein
LAATPTLHPPPAEAAPPPARTRTRSLRQAPDGSSFVTHWMLVDPALMAAFLGELSSPGQPGSWPWNILAAAAPEDLELGFSEYASYNSWVQEHHPEAQHMLSRRTWVRCAAASWPRAAAAVLT